MATVRYINTHFWDDTYVINLDPIEKLLFIYLITNPLTDIGGAYEINLRRISLDTGIDREMVLKILERFEKANKITFKEGWILIHNWVKNQKLNPSVEQGVVRSLNAAPEWVRQALYSLPTGCPQSVLLNLTKPNLRERDAESLPPPLDDLGKDLLIIETETVLKTKLDLEEKRAVAAAIHPSFTKDWGVYLKARLLKLVKGAPREIVIQTLGYALTDYRRDHKREYEQLNKPEQKLPTADERDRQREEWRHQPRTKPDGSTFVLQELSGEGQTH